MIDFFLAIICCMMLPCGNNSLAKLKKIFGTVLLLGGKKCSSDFISISRIYGNTVWLIYQELGHSLTFVLRTFITSINQLLRYVQSYTIVKVHQFTSMEDFVYLPKHVFILQQGVKFVDTKNTFSHLIVNYKWMKYSVQI